MATLASINKQRKDAGLAPVVMPGQEKKAIDPATVKVDPKTRRYTTSDPNAVETQSAINKGTAFVAPTNPRAFEKAAAKQAPKPVAIPDAAPVKPAEYITVDAPGGSVSYDANDWDPVTDEDGNVTSVTKKGETKSAVVKNKTELDTLLQSGEINQNQYETASDALLKGAEAVNPYGFREDKALVKTETPAPEMPSTPKTTVVQKDDPTRRAAVEDLVKQGVTEPGDLLDLLNYDEAGNRIGDFTMSEVQGMLPQNGKQAPEKKRRTTTTSSVIQAMIAKADPSMKGYLEMAMGMLEERKQDAALDAMDDVTLANWEYEQFTQITNDMLTRQRDLRAVQENLLQQNAEDDEQLAKLQKQQALRDNEMERQLAMFKANDEARNMERAHSKRIMKMSNRVAVAGGFGSMANLGEIEEADFQGEAEISRFRMDIQLMDKQYSDRGLAIESDYTQKVIGIHRGLSESLLGVVTRYNDKVDEIKSRKFGASSKRSEQIANARKTMRGAMSDIQSKALTLLNEARIESLSRQDALEKDIRQGKKDLWDDAMQYIDRYGTEDKTYLAEVERKLELPAGSLTKSMTLEERRMIKSRAGVGGAGGGGSSTVMSWLQENVNRLKQQFPTDSPQEILMKAAYLADQRFAGTSKGNINMRNSVYETIGDELGTTITSAGIRKEIDKFNTQSTLRAQILSSPDPESAMNEALTKLTTGSKAPFKGDEETASSFIVGLFEGTDVSGSERPEVKPVSSFWNVAPWNPMRALPGFTASKFSMNQ